ncbi:MAG: hypothetical protein FWG63_01115 [Defluviitaleaceae bacterium]|nr:hypothetical protein [Defluviitaleaceae bacterium]
MKNYRGTVISPALNSGRVFCAKKSSYSNSVRRNCHMLEHIVKVCYNVTIEKRPTMKCQPLFLKKIKFFLGKNQVKKGTQMKPMLKRLKWG